MTAPARTPLRHGVLGLLRDRTFGPFLVGKILSSCGIWIQNIAAAVLMYDLTGSAFMVGTVSVLQFAGPLVLALWAGALSDRFDRRRLLLAGRLVSGAAVGVLALLLTLRGTEGFGGPLVLLVLLFIMGIGLSVSVPAMQSLVPGLVEKEHLEQALALNSSAPSIARTVGPAAGAGLLLAGGPELAFAVSAASHGVFVVLLLFVRARRQERSRKGARILGGVRYLVRDRNAGRLMLAVALLGFGADTIVTLTPSLADQLGGGSEAVGGFATAFGFGSVLLVAVFGRMRRIFSLRTTGAGGFVVLAAGLALAAASPTIVLATGAFFVAGTGFMMGTVSLNTRIQRRVPDQLRGRVMALWGVAFLGSRPFAAMINGFVADAASVEIAMLMAATVVVAASLLAIGRYGTDIEASTAPDASRPAA